MRRSTWPWLAALLALGGCRTFAPPTAELLGRLRPMPLAGELGEQFVLELNSDRLAGVFDAVQVVDGDALRMQLFPDIGGKVFDLTVRAGAVVAVTPDGDYRAEPPLEQASPHLALVLAAMLCELREPLGAARVLGQRVGGEPGQVELLLRPALGSGRVVATVGPDGAVEAYDFELGWLAFRLARDGAFAGRGFSGRVCP
ncbi:MAG: hypothetical protein KAI24_00640 [Planctomycetes bacterium]|nr:hypothetical protein [Planctomycetota bacterium]